MNGYAVAQIEEIDEIDDGRVLSRPVRFHFGITSFGVNAFTAHQVGDRLINEHDESQEHDLQEELYLVQRGRATFELDGERVDAPAGTLVFVRPEVKRTAGRSTTLRAARASPVGQTTRSGISGSRSTARNRSVRLLPGTATSTRSATRPLSRNWFRATQPSQPRRNRLRSGALGMHELL